MDGVLIDSGAHHREAWRALLDELGVAPAQPDYWRLTIGRPGNEAVPLLLGHPLSWAEAMRLAFRRRPTPRSARAPGALRRGRHRRRRAPRQARPGGVPARRAGDRRAA